MSSHGDLSSPSKELQSFPKPPLFQGRVILGYTAGKLTKA